jgi:hypothetical protein
MSYALGRDVTGENRMLNPIIKLVIFCCRFLWRRFRARKGDGYEGVLQRDSSSDPLAVKSLSASGNLLTEEVST